MDADQDQPSTVDALPYGPRAAPRRRTPAPSAARPTRPFERGAGERVAHPEASRPSEVALTRRTAGGSGPGPGARAASSGSGT